MTERRRQQCRQAQRRYEQTVKGRATKARYNQRRLWIGEALAGVAATLDDALRIRAHIKERVSAFKQRQSADPRMEADTSHAV